MKFLLKIILITSFSLFGLAYIVLAPAAFHQVFPININSYSYIDAEDNRVLPYFIIGLPFFAVLWGWIGMVIFKKPLQGIIQASAVIMGSFLYFLAGLILCTLWPDSNFNFSKPMSALDIGIYTTIWCIISWVSAMIAKRIAIHFSK